MASSFFWFMPCYYPRPEWVTTGCLHTSKKSYRIKSCRRVHRAWWLILSSNPIFRDAVARHWDSLIETSHSIYGGTSRLSGWLICTKNDVDTRNFIHKTAAVPFISPKFTSSHYIYVLRYIKFTLIRHFGTLPHFVRHYGIRQICTLLTWRGVQICTCMPIFSQITIKLLQIV